MVWRWEIVSLLLGILLSGRSKFSTLFLHLNIWKVPIFGFLCIYLFCCFIRNSQLSPLDVSRRKWITLLPSQMAKSSSCVSNDLTPCIQWGYKMYFVLLGLKAPSDWPSNFFWLISSPCRTRNWRRTSQRESPKRKDYENRKEMKMLHRLHPLE